MNVKNYKVLGEDRTTGKSLKKTGDGTTIMIYNENVAK